MIGEFYLRNFKCFAEERLRLRPLTLLTGLNGMGKSSVIQAMLVLRQSFLAGELERGRLSTSGDLVDLGPVSGVLFESAKEDVIEIGLRPEDDDEEIRFPFEVTPDRDAAVFSDADRRSQAIDRLHEGSASVLLAENIAGEPPLPGFQYLMAERNGPRKFLPMSQAHANGFDLGTRGEYVLHILKAHKDSVLLAPNDPRILNGYGERLGDQVEAWLGEISPGVRLTLTPVPEADLIVGGFSFGAAGQLRSADFRATNVGFGLSYVLPILVSLLGTSAGGLVVIENPEAHMHPRGQTRLGELCARAAAAGVQVVVETHSDHLLDGARIAVREKILPESDAVFYYFTRKEGAIRVETPVIDSEGRLSSWPDGFFDQHRRNTARLVRPQSVRSAKPGRPE